MSSLSLYNSLTRQKEAFVPLDPGHVRMYACGPTVYNYAHIGNARMAVVFDQLARVLRHLYPRLTYVSNITDVDDKIMQAAQETGESIDNITEKFTRIYNEDMQALGVSLPDVQPLATRHIDVMIEIIQRLTGAGHAYEAQGHVLFHVPSFQAYGGLSGRTRDDQIAGARVEVAPFKKDPADFILWKPSQAHEPGWDSPWGRGRPGWHIECSAMAEVHLGLPFDIHGGGADLKFPHHENEIAQSCCAHGVEDDLSYFARFWVHNGFVTVEGEKMSKSLGNVLLAHDLLKDYPGAVLRLTLLSAHYRQPLDWSEDKILQSVRFIEKLNRRLAEMADIPAEETGPPEDFAGALYDDLNTPQAMMEFNKILKADSSSQLKGQILACVDMLGLDLSMAARAEKAPAISEAEIESLLAERQQARAEKNFDRADEIRDRLLEKGVTIEDTPEGPKWHTH